MTSNGEGIKIDAIGSPVAVRNTGWVLHNDVHDCVEGIDCDDYCDDFHAVCFFSNIAGYIDLSVKSPIYLW